MHFRKKMMLMCFLVLAAPFVHAYDCYLLTAPIYGPGFFSVFNTVIGALMICVS